MALVPGTVAADAGMAKAIYDHADALLAPPLQQVVDAASGDAKAKAQAALDGARDGWRKLSFAVASGVVEHLLTNLEIRGVQAGGSVSASVAGQTTSTNPGPHQHGLGLTATQNGVVFTQTNDGAGRIR
jgi:hypothetical protein